LNYKKPPVTSGGQKPGLQNIGGLAFVFFNLRNAFPLQRLISISVLTLAKPEELYRTFVCVDFSPHGEAFLILRGKRIYWLSARNPSGALLVKQISN